MGARAFSFGNRKARSDMIARMGGYVADIDVVQIVIPARRAIGESGKIGRSLVCGADDGRGPWDALRDFTAHAHGPLVEGGDAAAEHVDDVRFDAFDGRGIEIFVTQRRRVPGQSFRQRPAFGCTHPIRKAVHAERCDSGDVEHGFGEWPGEWPALPGSSYPSLCLSLHLSQSNLLTPLNLS
jgi:hypothetical protein